MSLYRGARSEERLFVSKNAVSGIHRLYPLFLHACAYGTRCALQFKTCARPVRLFG